MSLTRSLKSSLKYARFSLAFLAMTQFVLAGSVSAAPDPEPESHTRTPIKHVLIIIGENRTFDHVFATYEPNNDQRIWNLLSEGIVNEDGTPGPNYSSAVQRIGADLGPGQWQISPTISSAFTNLPAPLTGGPTTPYFSSVAQAEQYENGLPADYYQFLTTGGTGQPKRVPDARISYDGFDVNHLPSGPFQLTPGVPYDAYSASPVHRFYQMWQQLDCNAGYATEQKPSGCREDLFPWVEVSVGAGANGKPQPSPFTNATTGEGSTSMAFYNVLQGDAPYFKYLADTYSMSDNFHQSVEGGTGANHVMIGTGDAIWFSDGNGNPATPPANQIENPDPMSGTNNWYTQDGYSGGSYSECADASRPGVGNVLDYLKSLPWKVKPNCDLGHYYLLNNYNPGYFGDGTDAYTDTNPLNTPFTVPPSMLRTIGDELLEQGISWRYYGDQWNLYVKDPYYQNPANAYCNICNPFQYSTSIMTNATVRTSHLKDTTDLYADISNGWLPAVAFVKPSGFVDGHPASSKLDLFEGFVKKIVDAVQAQPELWKSTAIIVTFDEGGGYWDSGYVQPLDFFGDGTRIPTIVISPYSRGGHVTHVYADQVSILKFIEENWDLEPLTSRSRDNLPNPVTTKDNPYVPVNGPAIGDMMDFFHFGQGQESGGRNGFDR